MFIQETNVEVHPILHEDLITPTRLMVPHSH